MANEIKEITTAEFNILLEKENPQYSKCTDLEINKIYTITNTALVSTKKGEAMVLTLQNYGDVWAPVHLKTRIQKKKKKKKKLKLPMYIRPCGFKPCKDNTANKYHAYDLVVGKK